MIIPRSLSVSVGRLRQLNVGLLEEMMMACSVAECTGVFVDCVVSWFAPTYTAH